MVLLVGASLMIAVGLVGIYVGYIFHEVKRRPIYLLRTVHRREQQPSDGSTSRS
jgi:polyisoprenyl-phosphate glycosyltransferase